MPGEEVGDEGIEFFRDFEHVEVADVGDLVVFDLWEDAGEVVARAKEILANLEDEELGETGQPKLAQPRARKPKIDPGDQLSLFGH